MSAALFVVCFIGFLCWLAERPRDPRLVFAGTMIVSLAALALFTLAAAGR